MSEHLPNAVASEKALVGAVLMDPSIAGWLDVDPRAFYAPQTRAVWEAMRALSARGVAVDLYTLETELTRTGKLDPVGGVAGLGKLSEYGGLPSHVTAYAADVRSTWVARQVLQVASRARRTWETAGYGGDEFRDELIAELSRIASGQRTQVTTGDEAVQHAQAHLREPDREPAVIDTGVPGIAIPVATTTIVGARPGKGKTALILAMSAGIARTTGRHAIIALTEDREITLGRRLLADLADVDGAGLQRPERLNMYERARGLEVERPEWLQRLHIVAANGQTMVRAMREVRAIAHQHDVASVALDYIQRIKPADRRQELKYALAEAGHVFDDTICELGTAGILGSQLKRTAEGREPTMADLAETDGLTRAAKLGLLIHETGDESVMRIVVAKRNEGAEGGEIVLGWDRPKQRFSALEAGPPQPMHGGD